LKVADHAPVVRGTRWPLTSENGPSPEKEPINDEDPGPPATHPMHHAYARPKKIVKTNNETDSTIVALYIVSGCSITQQRVRDDGHPATADVGEHTLRGRYRYQYRLTTLQLEPPHRR
jgi:hypothetical protein